MILIHLIITETDFDNTMMLIEDLYTPIFLL